jgi:hypothetical protein
MDIAAPEGARRDEGFGSHEDAFYAPALTMSRRRRRVVMPASWGLKDVHVRIDLTLSMARPGA